MRFLTAATALCGLLLPSSLVFSESTSSTRVALPQDFKPPQVFKNANLVRNTNLDKGYVRETVNVVVENVSREPQSEYYLSFPSEVYDKLGGLEVRLTKGDKKKLEVETTEFDSSRDAQYYVVQLPKPIEPSSQITLGVSYSILNSLVPRPATIQQNEKQFLAYDFSAYVPSAYQTDTQKTKLKFPSTNVPDYTTTSGIKSGSGADPERQSTTYTYGPYDTAKIAPGTTYPITVRYEFTKPVITAHLLERDLEVSHWGGNLATEERYWLRNNGSQLANQFSRVDWTISNFQKAPTSAVRELKYPLKAGSADPYFIDDIGNVSTSRYRPGKPNREGLLELRPRYPIFGGWNYAFRIGWNNELSSFLRQAVAGADSYILKVPLIEGPKIPEGIQYENVVIRVVLPEGAKNVQFETVQSSSSNGLPSQSEIHSEVSNYKTFMDTLGRTTLTLTVENLSDEARDSQLLITYDYTLWDALRKPFTITAGLITLFASVWVVGSIDVSIKKR